MLPELRKAIDELSKRNQIGGCDRCNGPGARKRASMTAYDTSKVDLETDGDPNDPGFLCDSCYADYVDYWQTMWDEYYAGQGCYIPSKSS